MTGYKSKHVSMPAELHDRTTAIEKRLGCAFSKLVQVALKEKLPEWEAELGGFEIDNPHSLKGRILAAIAKQGEWIPAAELPSTAPPATQN